MRLVVEREGEMLGQNKSRRGTVNADSSRFGVGDFQRYCQHVPEACSLECTVKKCCL